MAMLTVRRAFGPVVMLIVVALLSAACAAATDDPVLVTRTVTAGASPAAGGAGNEAAAPSGGTSTSVAPSPPAPEVRFAASPRFGSTDLAPVAPVTVTAFNATIDTVVAVSESDGTELAGTVSADGGTWTLTDRMAYATTYRVTGTATARDGSAVPIDGQLSTVDPGQTVRATFQLAEGGTYGVAAPIIITFAGQVTDKAAAQARFTVTTDKGTIEGAWGWLPDEDILGNGVKQSRAHYRTKDYWPAYTTVTVTADLYGVDLGGAWGRADITDTFSIGRAQVVKADVNSYRLVVLVDGAVSKDYPVSYGRDTGDPELETRSGTHIVQEKHDAFTMCNPKYGYCGFVANWAVRISNNGEFIHENAAVIDSLGKANVSHGCVNMSPTDAKDFYDTALYGDPVEVTGTSPQLGPSDGDVYDWTYDYPTWRSLSAI